VSGWGVGPENIPPSYDEGTNGYNGIATTTRIPGPRSLTWRPRMPRCDACPGRSARP